MRTAHLLCAEGITAELWLGALIDAGAPVAALQEPIERAGIPAHLVADPGEASEVMATFVRVETDPGAAPIDTVPALEACIDVAGLSSRADARARAVAGALARAEAAVHGVPVDAVRFHELGRPRAAARILAGAAALEALDVDRVTTGAVALGGGVIDIAHGRFPVPVPAVLHLLERFTVHGGTEPDGELTTPSGAAVLAGLAEPVEAIPTIRLEAHGRGAIRTDDGHRLLTVMIGTEPGPTHAPTAA